jgi:hypothetical protein
MLRAKSNNWIQWEKKIVDMVMEMKFGISKYSEVFYRVGIFIEDL